MIRSEKENILLQKTIDKILKLISIRPRSEKEIRIYLKRKNADESIASKALSKLKEINLVNDKNFAKWWVESRQSLSPKSKSLIKQELKNKGIQSELIEQVFEETKANDEENAVRLLKKRSIHWNNTDKDKRKFKMLRYLIGRGFNVEIAKSAIKEYNKSKDDKVN